MADYKKFSKNSKSKSLTIGDNEMLMCEIILLDPTQPNFKLTVKGGEQGYILFNKVCDRLGGILEKDYFGLKYNDKHGQQQWLELDKSIYKQLKGSAHDKPPRLFSFRFKHYPRDPNVDLKHNLSRYLLYLQLRRDLYRGRLVGLSNVQCRLAALVLQVEIGRLDSAEMDTLVLSNLKILPSINRKAETKIMALYDTFRDLDDQEAENLFLDECSKLETYGVEPIAVKDQKGNGVFVGITYDGVSTYNGCQRLHTFPWKNILKVSFSHKVFMLHVNIEQKKHILGFKCQTTHAACALWKWAFDRQCFLTLDRASEAKQSKAGGSLFRRKKSHTFSGRSQRELSDSYQTLHVIPQSNVIRSHSMMTLLKCNNIDTEVQNTPDKRISSEFIGYATLPRPQERQTVDASESNDDGDLPKGHSKDNCDRSNHSAVLDFMQALIEPAFTPKRMSRRNSNSQCDIPKRTDNSVDSDNVNDEDDINFFSGLSEISNRDRCRQGLESQPDFNASYSDHLGNNIAQVGGSAFDSKEERKSGISARAVISLALLLVSVLLVVLGVVFSRNLASSANKNDD